MLMNHARKATDAAGATRRERFGTLPERVRPQEMVEERAVTVPDPAKDTYHADDWVVRYGL
jgi:hypothetical protein